MRRRITFLNILIAHTLALALTLLRFTQFFCERDVSGMRLHCARAVSLIRSARMHLQQRGDKGKKNCSPIQKQIVSILLLASPVAATPIF